MSVVHLFSFSEVSRELPTDIAELIAAVREARAVDRIREARYTGELERVREAAMLQSVKFSNEIEGIVTSDERLVDIVLRYDVPRTHSEAEIAGYRDALNMIHSNPDNYDLDERTVLELHRVMMSQTLHIGGHYKTRDNAIVSVSGGRRHIVFESVPASETEDAMEQLFLAYMEARDEGMEPLLLIPCVILDFLCIHPFADGNGRTSRLLTTALLYNNGFNVCRYVSMDQHIAMTKSEYYSALAASSKGWIENEWTYVPFIRYFLRTLYECYADMDTRFAVANDRKLKKWERVAAIIENSTIPISKRQICAALPDVSPRTVETVLARLQADESIEKIGGFKDARYRWIGKRN